MKRRLTAVLTATVIAVTAAVPAVSATAERDALWERFLAQEEAAAGEIPDGTIFIDSAGKISQTRDGVTTLSGGAQVNRDGVTLKADRIIVPPCRRFVYAEGNARVTDAGTGVTIRADRIRYDFDLHVAEPEGSVSASRGGYR